MPPVLSVEERARIAARYEVWGSDECKGSGVLNKLLTTGSVDDARRSGRSISRRPENVVRVRDMIMRSPKKSLRQGARESDLSRYAVATILMKDLSFKPWKPHYV
ncbi:hypothetical protein ANN_05220 [Periplaneta americana]|uniref:Transposase n=1 Tax=Periplaneta americana TaxID=6978 RepID=A0ABQ8TAG8_PERAM|nr:hypothetical protein ANN_05220 [Periplaneta americana]